MIKKSGLFYLEVGYFGWIFLTLSWFLGDAQIFDNSGRLGFFTVTTMAISVAGVISVFGDWKMIKCLSYAGLITASFLRHIYFPSLFHFALPVLNLLAIFLIWYNQAKKDLPLMGKIANLTLALSYLAAAQSKWADPLWRSGEAVYTILRTNFLAYGYVLNHLNEVKNLLGLLGWALMGFQVLYFLSVIRSKWLRPLNYLMMFFHFSTLAVMNVIPVSVAYLLLHTFILLTRPANQTYAVSRK